MSMEHRRGATEGCEANSRPVPGNFPNDRILHGPDCYRHKRVCVHFFPTPPWPGESAKQRVCGMRFSGMAESIGPMQAGTAAPPSVGRPRGPVRERDAKRAFPSSSAMSSGRLFLDRVARQQSPSPLHRQPHNTTMDNFDGTIYHRTVSVSYPPCLTDGGHPKVCVSSRIRSICVCKTILQKLILMQELLQHSGEVR